MIVGFNHNVQYRGVGFHVQTEDSGQKNPQLVTLLYHGGTIIASQKTLYSDIIKVDNLDQVVEDLAKEQHKGMLRRLTKGEFDQRIIDFGIPLSPPAGGSKQTQPPIFPAAAPANSGAAEDRKDSLPQPPNQRSRRSSLRLPNRPRRPRRPRSSLNRWSTSFASRTRLQNERWMI